VIFLDHSASTSLVPEVITEMQVALREGLGNDQTTSTT
jgi:hypothetical protein